MEAQPVVPTISAIRTTERIIYFTLLLSGYGLFYRINHLSMTGFSYFLRYILPNYGLMPIFEPTFPDNLNILFTVTCIMICIIKCFGPFLVSCLETIKVKSIKA